MEGIVNKVAQSGLITLDLEAMKPAGPRVSWDIKDQLWQGLVLKEKDFREYLKNLDLSPYQGAHVAIYCSADAIVPTWAYMLVASKLYGTAVASYFCSPSDLEDRVYTTMIQSLSIEDYAGKRIVVKGCGEGVPDSAYVSLVNRLQGVAKSVMFGEPCSTVPVFKTL
ncbi:MAG: hypothetical protein RLZZ77_2472 [Bacteroidota bacterium]|jgi:hypothetical protein